MAEDKKPVEPTKAEPKKSAGGCGFENKQYFSDSGNKMLCVLAKDHEGDHAAPFPEEDADETLLVYFSDAAGVALDKGTLVKLNAAKAKREAAAKVAGRK